MPYSHLVKVHVGAIPMAKLKKAHKLQRLSLTAHEVAGNSHTLHVHPEVAEKLIKAKQKGKGARFHHTHHEMEGDLHLMQGGSLWSWLRDKAIPFVKKNFKYIKPVITAGLDAVSAAYPAARPYREVARQLGVGVRKRGGVAKGSAEAKARMARVRAAKHSGYGFKPAGY